MFSDNKILNFSVLSQYLHNFICKNNYTQRVNEIKISNDCSNEVTQIVTISLNSFESSFTEFKKENFAELGIWGNSNSFFHEGNLLQMELNEEKMIISIKDENNQLKKKYEVKVNEEIDFKNSDIIQVGGVLDKYRILETTKQFLKKANSGNCGLSVYELNSNFYIEMGVSEQVNKGGGGMMMGGGLPMAGGVGGTSVVFNPTFSNFNSYKSNRVVSIKCLFDINFNHLKGDLKPLAFDKIKTFLDVKPEKKCQTIFQLDNAFYLGYYDGFKKLYNLTKFTD